MSKSSMIQKDGVRKIQMNYSVFVSPEAKINYFNLLWWCFSLQKIEIFQLQICFTV